MRVDCVVVRMTPLQIRMMDFIRDRIERTTFAPNLPEIATEFGISVPTAFHNVKRLVETGNLLRKPFAKRGLSLPETIDFPNVTVVSTAILRGELARRGLTFDALATPQPLAYSGRPCAATRCGVAVEQGKLMCGKHWFRVDRDLRDRLVRAFHARDVESYAKSVREAVDQADAFQGVQFDRDVA